MKDKNGLEIQVGDIINDFDKIWLTDEVIKRGRKLGLISFHNKFIPLKKLTDFGKASLEIITDPIQRIKNGIPNKAIHGVATWNGSEPIKLPTKRNVDVGEKGVITAYLSDESKIAVMFSENRWVTFQWDKEKFCEDFIIELYDEQEGEK